MKSKKLLNDDEKMNDLLDKARRRASMYAVARSPHSIPQAYMEAAFKEGAKYMLALLKEAK